MRGILSRGLRDCLAGLLRAGVAVRELFTEHRPAAVNPRPDRSEFDVQRGGDFVVGEPFEVAQHDGGAEVRRQFLQGGLDIEVQVVEFEALLRPGLRARQPDSASSASASKRIRLLRRAWSRNRLVVIRCSQPSRVRA